MPINSFVCQRRSCQSEFEAVFDPSGGGSPFCPICGGKPCKWLPKAVSIGTVPFKKHDSGMQELIDEHNERNAENPLMRMRDVKCERGQPAFKPPQYSNTVKTVFQGPFGPMPADVPVNVLRSGRPAFVQATLANADMGKIPVNKDGRPATDMAMLGGVVPRPSAPLPNIVKKG